MPDPVIVSASAKHTASFIFLHGLGDTGIDVMWCDVMRCDVMWRDVMWCDVMWWDVMWCDAMWCESFHFKKLMLLMIILECNFNLLINCILAYGYHGSGRWGMLVPEGHRQVLRGEANVFPLSAS